jgi:hypothetical protein
VKLPPAASRDLGRVAADADVDMLAPKLIGAGHLLLADRKGAPPEAAVVHRMVTTVVGASCETCEAPTARRPHSTPGVGIVVGMTDANCVAFLQWALPRLGRRWAGYRKVRRQVCRRVSRRMGELGLGSFAEYRSHLEREPDEWPRLDALTNITISRFYRDRAVYDFLVGALVLGNREALPPGEPGFCDWAPRLHVYRRCTDGGSPSE